MPVAIAAARAVIAARRAFFEIICSCPRFGCSKDLSSNRLASTSVVIAAVRGYHATTLRRIQMDTIIEKFDLALPSGCDSRSSGDRFPLTGHRHLGVKSVVLIIRSIHRRACLSMQSEPSCDTFLANVHWATEKRASRQYLPTRFRRGCRSRRKRPGRRILARATAMGSIRAEKREVFRGLRLSLGTIGNDGCTH